MNRFTFLKTLWLATSSRNLVSEQELRNIRQLNDILFK